jgi:Family of unknown function (DUF6085)
MGVNFCSHCGHRGYQHGEKGCKNVETTGHIVKVDAKGFTLKHPVAERIDDKLFDCQIHNDLVALPVADGVYAIVENGSGGWSFEPEARAQTQCECTVSFWNLR